MDERGIIDYIRSLAAGSEDASVEAGPGDDAACVRLGSERLVLSTDMVIEGTHFTADTPPEAVGTKAVGRALSDLAAMAAVPTAALLSVSFPPGRSDSYQRALCGSIYRECRRRDAPVVGGDTGSGTEVLVVALNVVGTPGPDGLVYRNGAVPGDAVCVTGALGGSLSGRHLRPQDRIRHALELAGTHDIHAMIDISDGLATDLLHVAEESGVGVVLNAGAIPVHGEARALARREGESNKGAIKHALEDGEDYELLFCLDYDKAKKAAFSGIRETEISIIGCISEGTERKIIWPDQSETELRDTGWCHLRNQ